MGISTLYLISTILSFVTAFVNVAQNKKIDAKYMALEIAIVANCLGRYVLSVSQSLETAVWAQKIVYFGAIFAPILLLYVSAQVCGVTIPTWAGWSGIIASVVMYGFVLTIGRSPIYYKSVSLVCQDGYSYLVREYGPCHIFFPMLLALHLCLLTFIVIRVVKNKNSMPVLPTVTLGIVAISTIIIYFLEQIFHSTVDWLVLPYIGASILVTVWQDRINMYDISLNVASTVERLSGYGYLVFDRKGRFVSANPFAKEVFPEISHWNIDKFVKPESSLAYREIASQLKERNGEQGDRTISNGNRFVKLMTRDIYYHGKKPVGYLVEVLDVTLEQMYTRTIENYNATLERQVKNKTKDMLQMKDNLLKSIAIMVESRDDSTGYHILRTSEVVSIFAKHLMGHGLDEDFLRMVVKAAPLHDLGKISVSDAVLLKQGKFTPEEYAVMQTHSEAGAVMVERVLKNSESEDFIAIAKNIAHYHHEKWNGTGYPAKLSGAQIPVEARIMAFADVFDALASKRCYKEAFSLEKSFEIIRHDLGSHFDPELGEIFLECREELCALYS